MVVILDDKSQPTPSKSPISSQDSGSIGSPPPYSDTPHSFSQASQAPAQAPQAFQASASSLAPLSDRKPTNNLEIYQACAPINGSWKIDSSLQMPRSTPRKPDEMDKDRPNVSLTTKIGTIDANIELAGGPEADRARLVNTTYVGTIDVVISSPRGQKFDLRCQTSTGTIDIYLPRSFHGPITLKSSLGSRDLSPGVEANFAASSKKTGVTEGFIGAYEGYGAEEGAEWKGDALYAQTSVGTIDVYYEDEKRQTLKGAVKGKAKAAKSKDSYSAPRPYY